MRSTSNMVRLMGSESADEYTLDDRGSLSAIVKFEAVLVPTSLRP